jgi:hypothetical protein
MAWYSETYINANLKYFTTLENEKQLFVDKIVLSRFSGSLTGITF